MEFFDSDMDAELRSVVQIAGEGLIFNPLGFADPAAFTGSLDVTDALCQLPFNDFDYGIPSQTPLPSVSNPYEPQIFSGASSALMNEISLNDEFMSATFPGNLEPMGCGPILGTNMNLLPQDMPLLTDNYRQTTSMEPFADGFSSTSPDPYFNCAQVPPSFWPLSGLSTASGTPELDLSPTSSPDAYPLPTFQDQLSSILLPTLQSSPVDHLKSERTSLQDSDFCRGRFPPGTASNNSSSSPSSSSSTPEPQDEPVRRMTRSSTSKALLSHARFKLSAATSKVPCSIAGCKKKFYDRRTRDRHVASVHNRVKGASHMCPGLCRDAGFSREDALNRHLKDSSRSSRCSIEARKLGWSPNVKSSVQLLRDFSP